jgi:hypothetical protein
MEVPMTRNVAHHLSLDDRIAAAFGADAKSEDVAALVAEAEAAAVAAGESAERAKARALSPTTKDVEEARREMEAAGFNRDRLRAGASGVR